MAVIAAAALKGGVGKTTTAIHLAHGLAKAGYQTLLIDCDVASNASRFFNVIRGEDEPGILDLLKPQRSLGITQDSRELRFKAVARESFVFNVRQNLDLVPGNRSLRLRMADQGAEETGIEDYLAQVLAVLRQGYSFMVLDTSPELNLLTSAAIRAADLLVLPIDGGAMAIEALEDLFNFMRQHQLSAQSMVLRTMLDRRAGRTATLCQDALAEYLSHQRGRKSGRTGYQLELDAGLLETIIHRSELVNQLTHHRKSAFDLAGTNAVAIEYQQLVQELIYLVALKQRTTQKVEVRQLTNQKQDLRRAG